jgi:hypothetical protein
MRCLRLCEILIWLAFSLAAADPSFAQHEHTAADFEVFLAAEAFHSSRPIRLGDADPWVNADLVLGVTEHHFRVFGEYYVTPDERDLERFQMGFEFVPETVLWLGRFHQPASAWNTEHHHGQYLQTDITRPYIERWEDEHGLIPQHITGALFESRQAVGKEGAIQLATGVGASPAVSDSELDPIDLIGNNPGRHRLSLTARLAYLPQYVGASSMGLLFAHNDLAVSSARAQSLLQANAMRLDLYGAFLDWTVEQWRVVAAGYYVDIAFANSAHRESFISGYLQVERRLPKQFTIFGRLEESTRMQESRYVAIFDDADRDIEIAVRREALGVRWDFRRRQALTLEVSHVDALTLNSDELRLQWSAAVP